MMALLVPGTNAHGADDGSKPADMSKPAKVYIMMGQSNTVGIGKHPVLEAAVKQNYFYLESCGSGLPRA